MLSQDLYLALGYQFLCIPCYRKSTSYGQFHGPEQRISDTWKWSFGDGNDSTEKNPVHTYNKEGNYTVALTTTSQGGSNRVQISRYISVTSENSIVPQKTVDAVPVTAFSATPAIGSVPLTVSFKDQSTGAPTAWKWTFGDGGNSTEKNPVHTYNKAGKYNVTLTASNANGNNALTKTGYILVSGVSDAPLSRFSASPTSGKAPLTVSFTDQSTGLRLHGDGLSGRKRFKREEPCTHIQ